MKIFTLNLTLDNTAAIYKPKMGRYEPSTIYQDGKVYLSSTTKYNLWISFLNLLPQFTNLLSFYPPFIT